MKTKFAIALVLAVVCLLLVAAGVSTAQPKDPNKTNLDYKVYLPLVSKPPCTYKPPAVYGSVSKPVVRVSEIVTVTGALVNNCAEVGKPLYYLNVQPEGMLYPSYATIEGYPRFVSVGSYQEFTFTVQAVGTGVVTVSVAANYETVHPDHPYLWLWESVGSTPSVMRVLP
jgi:hypothetical protein